MKKTYEIIVTIVMITCVSLMFVKLILPVSAVLIWILALLSAVGILPKFIKDPDEFIILMLVWIFITLIWAGLAAKETNEKFEVKEQQPVELIYKT